MIDPAEWALLEAIRDRPDDLARRRIHADWLEEHGQADVAALIRVHAEMEDPDLDPQRQKQLEARHAELLEANRERWPVHALSHHFRLRHETQRARGPVGIWIGVEAYPGHAEVLGRVAPLADVELSETTQGEERELLPDSVFGPVADCPWLAGWSALQLGDHIYSAPGLAILLGSPHLTRLRALKMFESFGGDEVRAWITVPRWPALTKLDLNGVVQGDELTAELARSGHLRGLTELTLIYNEIGDEGARALADCADLAGLTRLELYGNEIGDAGALALARSPHLGNLQALDIDNYGRTELGPATQAALRERFGERVQF
jgi:uncharacterized protein (TIGR02996 family)